MSWKSFACVAALSALIASPALAQPSLNWVDNGGSATLQIIPSGVGSVGAEIAITFTGAIDAAAIVDFDTDLANDANWQFANPGDNPFTGAESTGLFTTNLGSGEVFASYGSNVFTTTDPIDFITLDYSVDGTFSVSSAAIGESVVGTPPSQIFSPTVADLMVTASVSGPLPGDADGDGDVDGDDLIAVQTNFGSVTPPPGDADNDGDVDGDDLIAVQTSFGNTAPASATATAVPEPTSLVILGGFALAGLATRRRV